jgi:hypothetical protein
MFFHTGGLSKEIIQGNFSRDEIYGTAS